jgi:hypothetical protein
MISAVRKVGTTIGGTNHEVEVPEAVLGVAAEAVLVLLSGVGLEAPPSSSQRAMAVAWWF